MDTPFTQIADAIPVVLVVNQLDVYREEDFCSHEPMK
jgi:hypothetical protein